MKAYGAPDIFVKINKNQLEIYDEVQLYLGRVTDASGYEGRMLIQLLIRVATQVLQVRS